MPGTPVRTHLPGASPWPLVLHDAGSSSVRGTRFLSLETHLPRQGSAPAPEDHGAWLSGTIRAPPGGLTLRGRKWAEAAATSRAFLPSHPLCHNCHFWEFLWQSCCGCCQKASSGRQSSWKQNRYLVPKGSFNQKGLAGNQQGIPAAWPTAIHIGQHSTL